jgi:hypothetical protein
MNETRADYNAVITTSNAVETAITALGRGDFQTLTAATLKCPQPKCPVIHHFCPGLYIREAHLSAGDLIVGHFHKSEHTNIFLKGKLRMFRQDGSFEDLTAPMMFVGQPGQKVAYILEDVIWQNVYATTERDVEKLEAEFFKPDPLFKSTESRRIELESLKHAYDREDYSEMLGEEGLDAMFVHSISRSDSDMRPFPYGPSKVKTGSSPIQGTGLFATADVRRGEVIAPARIAGLRTPAGRYCNHSPNPNAAMALLPNGDVNLIAIFPIHGCVGGQDGEEITVDYRQVLRTVQYKKQEEVCQQS